jgi:alkylation response protein AidB-like acyl-CoA dehydrogenase
MVKARIPPQLANWKLSHDHHENVMLLSRLNVGNRLILSLNVRADALISVLQNILLGAEASLSKKGPTMTATTLQTDWLALARDLGREFAPRAAAHDADDSFVAENYDILKVHHIFSAPVPQELGGGGASHAELCEFLRILAQSCSSTALALSMHMHLLAATVWRWRQGHPVEPLLKRIVQEQTVLISSGGSDWLDSSGTAEKVDGGYRITARKIFSSGCPQGDLLMTTAVYDDPEDGPTVLHFPVPFADAGVTIMDTWHTLGMRGTGSHDVMIEGVFVPESAVALRRPKGLWHLFFNVVAAVALPLIMAVYVGVAESAQALALERARHKQKDPQTAYLIGEMTNALVTAQMALQGMMAIADNYDFEPIDATANAILIRKTIAARAAITAVEKAMEVVGGSSFYRSVGLERLWRDVQGGLYHPLHEKRQQLFTGRMALGLNPVG